MRYLAKVERTSFLGGAVLQLLAQQIEGYLWERLSQEKAVETEIALGVGDGAVILVELDESETQVTAAEEAIPWLMHLVDTFLSQGITPDFLAEEAERAEQWRQSLTLESQEVERRALETVARRDEIQELEKSLKLAREELEKHESEFAARLHAQDIKNQELQKLETSLQRQQEELEKREAECLKRESELLVRLEAWEQNKSQEL